MLHKLLATAIAFVLAIPALAFACDDEPASAYYLLNVTGFHHSDMNFEAEVNVVEDSWAVMQCGDTKQIVSFVAVKFSNSNREFDYRDTPAEIIPLLRHVRSGDFEAWYYVPNCDQLGITWSRTDLKGVMLGREEVSLTNRAANIKARGPEFVPQGSITLSL